MTWKANVMVVANKTADSPELLEVLRARAAQGPAEFVLVFPQTGTDHAGAVAALEHALEAMLLGRFRLGHDPFGRTRDSKSG